MRTCEVSNCTEPADGLFVVSKPDSPMMQTVACQFHLTALREGEPFTWDFKTGEVQLGSDIPPEIVRLNLKQSGVNDPILRLGLGHDGIESSSVEIRYTADTIAKLKDVLGYTGNLQPEE